MLQRKQSVFYLLAILSLLIPLFGLMLVSFTKYGDGNEVIWEQKVTVYKTVVMQSDTAENFRPIADWPIYFINLALILLLFVLIFSYKKLSFQIKLGRITVFGLLGALAIVLLKIYNSYAYTEMAQPVTVFGSAVYFYVLAIILALAGNWGVKKDLKLLASVDRIR